MVSQLLIAQNHDDEGDVRDDGEDDGDDMAACLNGDIVVLMKSDAGDKMKNFLYCYCNVVKVVVADVWRHCIVVLSSLFLIYEYVVYL